MWRTSVLCRSSQHCCWRKRQGKACLCLCAGTVMASSQRGAGSMAVINFRDISYSFNIFYIFFNRNIYIGPGFSIFSISPSPPHPLVKVDICHCPPCHTHCTDAHFPFSYHFVIMLGVSSVFLFYYDHSVNAVHSGRCCYLRLLSFTYTILFSL